MRCRIPWFRAPVALIRVYKLCISPYLGHHCRFAPTCSTYAMEALEQYGLWRGSWMSLKRICKCHPFHPGGYDPVPADKPNLMET